MSTDAEVIHANGVHRHFRVDGERILLPHHLKELRVGSGLSDETIRAAGIFSELNADRLARWAGCPKWKQGPAIVYPHVDFDGEVAYRRLKPDSPRVQGGKPVKYIQPKGVIATPYFPPGVRDAAATEGQELAITEGEKKALKLTQDVVPTIAIPGVWNSFEKKSYQLHVELEGINWKRRRVYVVFDSDTATNDNVRMAEAKLAAALEARGADVRIVRLPCEEDGSKNGADDYLVNYGAAAMRKLLDEAEPPEETPAEELKAHRKTLDAAAEAKRIIEQATLDDVSRLRFWSGAFWRWKNGAYRPIDDRDVRGEIWRVLDNRFYQLNQSDASNVLDALKAFSELSRDVEPVAWLSEDSPPFPVEHCVPCRNGMVSIQRLVDGSGEYHARITPRLFTTCALDIDFNSRAPEPTRWLSFLDQLFGDDRECIALLQQWLGYLLLPDTSQQKFLCMIGPPRAGKGVITNVIRELVGVTNCVSQTAASLAMNFGLWPLVGSSLCIVPDARMGRRTDQSLITERILSIVGEDTLTIDRKHRDAVTLKLSTRLMLVSNEMPALYDSSGAVVARMLVLPLTRSFLGQEDPLLLDKLREELPGILLWAIDGWAALRQQGRFIQPEAGRELLDQAIELGSPVKSFVNDYCDIDSGAWAATDDLFAAWVQWAEKHGHAAGSSGMFAKNLKAAFSGLRQERRRAGDERVYGYAGIGIKLGPRS